ncbi:MAG: ABC transporter permease subunit [Planctomycetes bacterium]|nr:ABC transporter permease subunit [Planctomycetota bacterium]
MSNIYTIGLMTYKEAVRQPLLYIVAAISVALLFISPLFSLFGFGEELSMVREVGLATITFAGLLIAILISSQVITSEIERLSVMTLLSKPVRRSEFILGKFAGIVAVIALATAVLGGVFILIYWLNEGLPQIKEALKQGKSASGPFWAFVRNDALLLAKGVYCCFLEVVLLTAFAVLLAVYFPLVLTAAGCFIVFALGHISNYFYHGLSGSAVLKPLGWLAVLLLPDFTILNVASIVAGASALSVKYLLWITLYTVIYSAIILLVSIVIFSRREIR